MLHLNPFSCCCLSLNRVLDCSELNGLSPVTNDYANNPVTCMVRQSTVLNFSSERRNSQVDCHAMIVTLCSRVGGLSAAPYIVDQMVPVLCESFKWISLMLIARSG